MYAQSRQESQGLPQGLSLSLQLTRSSSGPQHLNLRLLCEQADGVVFPGGFGAAKNLSTFGYEGADMSVDAEVIHLLGNQYNFSPAISRFHEFWRNFIVLANPRRCAALPQLSLPR